MPIARYTTQDNPNPQIGYVEGEIVYSMADIDGFGTIEALLQLSAEELVAAAWPPGRPAMPGLRWVR